jgi:hypothetical protein
VELTGKAQDPGRRITATVDENHGEPCLCDRRALSQHRLPGMRIVRRLHPSILLYLSGFGGS